MQKINKKVGNPLLCLVLLTIAVVFVGQQKTFCQDRRQAWETSEQIHNLWHDMGVMIDSTLPQPALIPEDPYTLGNSNSVYWNSEDAQWLLDSVGTGFQLLFFEIKSVYEDVMRWGFVDVGVDSATFNDLPIGIPIHYMLRYYAQDGFGEFGRSFWSAPVTSIQDGNPPYMEAFAVLDLQRSGGVPWLLGPIIDIRVQASDPQGQVMQVVIQEKSEYEDLISFFDLDEPLETLDMTIPYQIQTPAHETLTLSGWVLDVAGQESNEMSETLFWIDGSEGAGRLISFPNPYNPEEDGSLTIKVGVPGITEARIYDPFGNLVTVLKKELFVQFFSWNGKNNRGDKVSNGGYICVVSGESQLYSKIAVLR